MLKSIISDFVDYSDLQSGDSEKFVLSICEFSLISFVEEIERIMLAQMKNKDVFFRLCKDKNLPQFVFGDKERLKQITLNLLLNAHKYTTKGWIKFSVRHAITSKTRKGVLFEVSDSGIGIAPEKLPYIFDYLRNHDEMPNKDVKASAGLGLTIS